MMSPSQLILSILTISFTTSLAQSVALGGRSAGGCGQSHSVGGSSTDVTITSSNTSRQYRIHLPETYDSESLTPVILSFHGNSKTMYDQENLTQFSLPSINPNMIAVYPQGLSNSWEGAPYHSATLPSDKIFVTDLLANLNSEYCIDSSRIYANGMSNGGGFVNTLACSPSHGGDFAAFAPVSGAFYDDDVDLGNTNCQPARSPLPMLEFHGFADDTIPYEGGKGKNPPHGSLPEIPDWLDSWAVLAGCPKPPQRTEQHDQGYIYLSYSCGGVDSIVSHYNISNLGHHWPSKMDGSPIDASPIIMDFFNAHSKP